MKNHFLYFCLFLALPPHLSAQCLSPLACPSGLQTVCDATSNGAQLWNDSLFYDFTANKHDLSEAPADLSMQLTDSCGAGNVQVS